MVLSLCKQWPFHYLILKCLRLNHTHVWGSVPIHSEEWFHQCLEEEFFSLDALKIEVNKFFAIRWLDNQGRILSSWI